MTLLPRERAEQDEERLSRFAARSTDVARAARRRHEQDADPYRTEFFRDYTRIIHSRAFRRLRNKTQVFVLPQNDHICTRMEHSLHVASVARTIAQALNLNLDLVAAIAVGHDLGHAPFGHRGERCLDRIAKKHGLRYQHESQSLWVVDVLESPYPEHAGLNLTFAVRDGIVMHCGEDYKTERLVPDRDRDSVDASACPAEGRPATLEGCVVRWADKVAYLGRDFEDAVTAKIVARSDLPDRVTRTLGDTNREIIAKLVDSIVKNSCDKDFVAVQEEVRDALSEFKDFSIEKIYKSPQVTECFAQIELAMGHMFDQLVPHAEQEPDASRKGSVPADHDTPGVLRTLEEFKKDVSKREPCPPPEQLVLDFMGGMTDSFFIVSYRELFLPHGVA